MYERSKRVYLFALVVELMYENMYVCVCACVCVCVCHNAPEITWCVAACLVGFIESDSISPRSRSTYIDACAYVCVRARERV